MPTQTRTSTGTATKVALGIAIGASAAFAAVSLNSSFTNQKMMGGKRMPYSSGPMKEAPGYQVESVDYCVNKCFIAHSQCVGAGRNSETCGYEFDRCRSLCPAPAPAPTPGYVPGYVPPVKPTPGDVPGYVPSGYVPGYMPSMQPKQPPKKEDLPAGYVWPGGVKLEKKK